MGIDTLTEYIVVGIGLLVLLGGLGLGLLRGRGGRTTELPPERRPPERPKGSTDHRSGTIVLDRQSDHATGDRGGDPVSLAAYLFGLTQTEAARRLAAMLGVR